MTRLYAVSGSDWMFWKMVSQCELLLSSGSGYSIYLQFPVSQVLWLGIHIATLASDQTSRASGCRADPTSPRRRGSMRLIAVASTKVLYCISVNYGPPVHS
jgi:hypothetical protein